MESKEKQIRTFIAVPVKPTVQLTDFLLHCQEELSGERIKWVNIMQMHFTLKFLGDVNESSVQGVSSTLARSLSGLKGFDYSLEGIGTFGRKYNPRVIWCGVDKQDSFVKLKEVITSIPDMQEREKEIFIPHLTLGRIKYLKNYEKLKLILDQYQNMNFGNFQANRIVLYRSELHSTGPVYSELSSINF